MRKANLFRVLVMLTTLATAGVAMAQTSTLTEREREGKGSLEPELKGDANMSAIPRYFLDTIDVLEREADDAKRTAPGLSKNNYIVKTYQIRNTRAIELQSYLLRMVAFEGGVCEVMGLGGVDGDGPESQYLICAIPDFMEPYVDEFVRLADVPGFKFYDATGRTNDAGIPGAVSYIGKHRTASELVSIVSGTELGNVAGFLFPPFADDSTNQIYLVENPSDIADDIAALEMFDLPPLQMELHVVIWEVKQGEDIDLGLDWDAWKRQISGEFFANNVRNLAEDETDVFDTGFFLSLDAVVLTDFLNYLTTTGSADKMLDTYVTMVNSEDVGGLGGARGASTQDPAVISVTNTFPFQIEDEVRQAETGVTVTILPFIATQSTTLDVDVVVTSLTGFAPDGVPLINNRETSSVINIVDGKTIILGGLDKTTQVTSTRGFPLLKNIPGLKFLFANEVTQLDDSTIVLAVTPKIKNATTDESAAVQQRLSSAIAKPKPGMAMAEAETSE